MNTMRLAPLSLFAGVLIALTGCNTPAPTAGNDAGTTGGHDASTDTGATSGEDGGLDGGGSSGASCADLAEAGCAQLLACAPVRFAGAYETMADCLADQEAYCESSDAVPLTNGPVDREACIASIAASCDAYLDPRVSGPCAPAPGDVALNGDCAFDAQCGMGEDSDGNTVRLYCYGATSLACMDGSCAPPDRPMTGRNTCTNADTGRDNCDTFGGYACVAEFDEDAGDHLDPRGRTCLEMQYGRGGDDCAPGSDHACDVGFVCQAATSTCMAVLTLGSSCDPTASLCDVSRSEYCGTDEDGNAVCVAPTYVRVGAQCGTVDGVVQQCSASAICNGATPSVCELRRAEGETCTATPDNCRFGLTCTSGTCRPPEPETCD